MNKAKLKSYAPQARKDFIAAVEARAHSLGLSEMGGSLDIAPSEKKGDVTLIAGQAWPAKVHDQRQRLIKRMKKEGFGQTVEAVAYTWFNRFAALRYMEIHDYLDHGYRVLSSREGGLPEIIAHATDVAGNLPGLNVSQIEDMKLAGNQDGELYRLLLVAQCNALSKAMPFLFEHIDDESELLLPGNLERTDSVVAKLVESIAEEDWSEVEIIGWLYQFYISEKKDAVIGKVVKSEDIPAATQLFTPNWIVQYLVQNCVGRLWLMANPGSTLKSQWKYYIEPAEQTPEVQAQLDALIQTRMAEDGGSLNPETITVLDPACGSGHILVEAYEVLKAIYLERGYQARAIPRLILERNLFGLDIDDRAAQMAGFALMMKARADDRRLLDSPIKLNVFSLQESKGLELDEFDSHLKPFGISRALLASLIDTFAHAKTFGSLILIPEALKRGLPTLADGLGKAIQSGDVFAQAAAHDLLPLAGQATVLAMKFDAVVANPPYMGGKFFNPLLKEMIAHEYELAKGDLYSCFLARNLQYARSAGIVSMITIPNWMFLSGFEEFRRTLLAEHTIETFCHNGRGVFGSDFGSCSFTISNHAIGEFKGKYKRLFEKQGSVANNEELNTRFFLSEPFLASSLQFQKVPGLPLAYWVSDRIRDVFSKSTPLIDTLQTRLGMSTADNDRFLRYWHEVSVNSIMFNGERLEDSLISVGKWFPYQKGGLFRKWYGNHAYVVDWENDGDQIKGNVDSSGRIRSHNYNGEFSFREGVTWSDVTSGANAFRYMPQGFLFDGRGSAGFSSSKASLLVSLGLLNSKVSFECIAAINPTIAINVGEIGRIPFHSSVDSIRPAIETIVEQAIKLATVDWDSCETSWNFAGLVLGGSEVAQRSIQASWESEKIAVDDRFKKMKLLENENNRLFIEAYGLQDELSPEVPDEQITLARADREKDCQRLISYTIGCMMGRYSLDEPGLIYAHIKRVFVVISDAFRYEAAEELVRDINGKSRFKAVLTPMLGVLPSYTALGMAALLPHDTLAYKQNANLDLATDGSVVSTVEQRSDQLAKYQGVAIKADDLLALGKDKGREYVRDQQVIYVYHDKIDLLGDKQGSEQETFDAVAQTLNELNQLASFIVNSLNASLVLMTADHGFLYQDSPLDDASKSTLGEKPDGTLKAKKRYLLGQGIGESSKAWCGNTHVTAGTTPGEGSMDFWVPRGAARFHFAGGARFVHGSAMPQEIVIPVITLREIENESAKTRAVEFSLLGSSNKVVTNKQRFEFIQNEPVSERVLPRSVLVSLRDGEALISDELSVTFDSTSGLMDERKRSVMLTVKSGSYDKAKDHYLIARDAQTKVEVVRIPLKVDLAFANDF